MPDLYPHQITGAQFLARRQFAFLWDEMGTGKTPTAIVACKLAGAKKILVCAPAVMRTTWYDEFTLWSDYPTTIVEGYITSPPGQGVTIVSHDCLANQPLPIKPGKKPRTQEVYALPTLLRGGPYDVIILDEGHRGFTDINATRAKAFYYPGGLVETARQVWTLTGTPLVNSAADLWLPAYGPLRQPVTWWDWCQTYPLMKPSMDGLKPTGIKNEQGLAQFLRPHTLRRTIKSLGINLPPLRTREWPIELHSDELKAIMAGLDPRATAARVRLALEDGRDLSDPAIARVRHALGQAKAPFVTAHILSSHVKLPLVVFFWHTEVRERICAALREQAQHLTVSWIDGTVTHSQFRAAKEWFQRGDIDVLLVQIQAGGVGLTLTRSHHCILAELPWTAVARDQAIARIHRITQQHDCTADIFKVQDCWLENLLSSVIAKKALASDKLLSLLTTDR